MIQTTSCLHYNSELIITSSQQLVEESTYRSSWTFFNFNIVILSCLYKLNSYLLKMLVQTNCIYVGFLIKFDKKKLSLSNNLNQTSPKRTKVKLIFFMKLSVQPVDGC